MAHGRMHHSMNNNISHFRTMLIAIAKYTNFYHCVYVIDLLVIDHWFEFTKIVLSRDKLRT